MRCVCHARPKMPLLLLLQAKGKMAVQAQAQEVRQEEITGQESMELVRDLLLCLNAALRSLLSLALALPVLLCCMSWDCGSCIGTRAVDSCSLLQLPLPFPQLQAFTQCTPASHHHPFLPGTPSGQVPAACVYLPRLLPAGPLPRALLPRRGHEQPGQHAHQSGCTQDGRAALPAALPDASRGGEGGVSAPARPCQMWVVERGFLATQHMLPLLLQMLGAADDEAQMLIDWVEKGALHPGPRS